MRTDVQTLIAALTTERNALDRAITALKQVRGEDAARVTHPTPAPQRRARRSTRRHWTHISDEVRATLVAAMRAAPYGTASQTAQRLAREFGCSPFTIATRWQVWERRLATAEGNGTDVAQETEPVLV